MERARRLQMTGYTAFFLSGICAISSGVVVSLQAGMICNLVPCVGIMVLSMVVRKLRNKEEACTLS